MPARPSYSSRSVHPCVFAPLLAAALAACGADGEVPAAHPAAIVDGTLDSGHPSVGILVSGGIGYCTSTLVGKHTVLTAGHCVTYNGTKKLLSPVVFIHNTSVKNGQLYGTKYQATQVVLHPSYSGGMKNDIAVVRLGQDVAGGAPFPVATQAPSLGEQLTLVGYGATAWGGQEFGVKRKASNVVGKVDSTTFIYYGTGGGKGTVCSGDSGGPSFAVRGTEEVLVGVHSVTLGDPADSSKPPCKYAGADMRVDAYHAFISQAAQGDVTPEGSLDTTPPTVSFVAPADKAAVQVPLQVEVAASDEVGVERVTLLVDGLQLGQKTAAPYTFSVDQLSPGDHALVARARDPAGNEATASIQVVVAAAAPDLSLWSDGSIGPTLPPMAELPQGDNTLQGGCAVAGGPAPVPTLPLLALWALLRLRGRA